MHDATARLKNGTVLQAALWTWRPSEGWFELLEGGKIRLADVVSLTQEERTHPGVVEVVDLLQRARDQGWDGT